MPRKRAADPGVSDNRENHYLSSTPVVFLLCIVATLLLASEERVAFAAVTSSVQSGFYGDARARFAKRDYRGAIVQLKSTLQENPVNLAARILIGKAYVELHEPGNAIKELLRARRDGADDNLIISVVARAYLMQGDLDTLFDQVPLGPFSSSVSTDLQITYGKAYLELGLLDKALAAFDESLRLTPGNVKGLTGQARTLLSKGELARAKELGELIRIAYPEHAETWQLDAEVQRHQGDLNGSLASLDKAISVAEFDDPILLVRAATLVHLGEDERALADLELVRQVAPNDPRSAYLRALVLARNNQIDEAHVILKVAEATLDERQIPVRRNYPPALLLSGLIDYAQGDFDEAYQHLSRHAILVPQHEGTRKLLALIFLERNDPQNALTILEPALQQNSNDASLLALASSAYIAIGNYKKATPLFERAANFEPDSSRLREHLALNRLALGERNQAIANLKDAANLDPGSSRASIILGLLYLKQKDFNKALAIALTVNQRNPENPSGFNLAGTAYAALGNFDKARESFLAALTAESAFFPAAFNLARLDLDTGHVEQAIKRFTDIYTSHPNDSRALIELAAIERRRGNMEQAIRYLEKVRAIVPDEVGPRTTLIGLYLEKGDMESAAFEAAELERRFPKNRAVLLTTFHVERALGKTGLARVTLRRIGNLREDSAANFLQLADLQRQVDDDDGARWSLQKELDLDPNNWRAKSAVVELDLVIGEFDRALSRAQALVIEHPKLAIGHRLSGAALMRKKQFQQAIAEFQLGLDKKPNPRLVKELYHARHAAGDPNARQTLTSWLETHPDDITVRKSLAGALLETGDHTEAAKQHLLILDQNPMDVGTLNNLALLYLRLSNPAALEHAQRAYAIAPHHPAILDTLGWILVERDEVARALELLREAYARESNDPVVRYHLAVALRRLGRDGEARAELATIVNAEQPFPEQVEARALLKQLSGQE